MNNANGFESYDLNQENDGNYFENVNGGDDSSDFMNDDDADNSETNDGDDDTNDEVEDTNDDVYDTDDDVDDSNADGDIINNFADHMFYGDTNGKDNDSNDDNNSYSHHIQLNDNFLFSLW